jgi:hypothetical protein
MISVGVGKNLCNLKTRVFTLDGMSGKMRVIINLTTKQTYPVMPDLIPDEYGIFDRHPVPTWIPAFAGMTILRYLIAGIVRKPSEGCQKGNDKNDTQSLCGTKDP